MGLQRGTLDDGVANLYAAFRWVADRRTQSLTVAAYPTGPVAILMGSERENAERLRVPPPVIIFS